MSPNPSVLVFNDAQTTLSDRYKDQNGEISVLKIRQLATSLIGPIDLTLEQGSCTTISGPSGSGKSLFLRAISDLDENTGQVLLKDRPREQYSAPEWRRKIGYVPAESGWWTDNVAEHFLRTEDISALLMAIGLPDALSWHVARLSTGERQRLALVRAIQRRPDVLLLDEPTSALDPPSVALVEVLLKRQLQEGRTLLLVSHDPAQPKRLGGRTFLMAAGKLMPSETFEATS